MGVRNPGENSLPESQSQSGGRATKREEHHLDDNSP